MSALPGLHDKNRGLKCTVLISPITVAWAWKKRRKIHVWSAVCALGIAIFRDVIVCQNTPQKMCWSRKSLLLIVLRVFSRCLMINLTARRALNYTERENRGKLAAAVFFFVEWLLWSVKRDRCWCQTSAHRRCYQKKRVAYYSIQSHSHILTSPLYFFLFPQGCG